MELKETYTQCLTSECLPHVSKLSISSSAFQSDCPLFIKMSFLPLFVRICYFCNSGDIQTSFSIIFLDIIEKIQEKFKLSFEYF